MKNVATSSLKSKTCCKLLEMLLHLGFQLLSALLIGITNLLPLGSKHGNYNGPSQLPSVIDDRSILKPQAECVNIQQSKRWKCLSKQNLFSCTSPKNVRTHAPSKRKVKKSRTCAKIKSILRFFIIKKNRWDFGPSTDEEVILLLSKDFKKWKASFIFWQIVDEEKSVSKRP